MNIIIELLKITLPAIIVCYAVYLIVRTFVLKELEKIKLELSFKNTETTLPVRLQAYERMCLFLERISPNNIIPRLNATGISARELQALLLNDIREEFNHNLSQQIYMSDKAWNNVKLAMETNISLINESASGLADDASAMDLARAIYDKAYQSETNSIDAALYVVKEEIRKLF
ncbi:MAG: hypothetical protein WBA74_01070 [Cyclobacteriaceae bacterium]